ncbi:MAG: MBL fold metallo-hydrolase [Eubacteriaceae bacterium]|jgi:glyoxylase-like metal-dependent hydrolase (beta-lactamase superfamily II)|nr:MBL fold metallo-hydrolase [Eubacteriaceae bacterium]
MNIENMPSGFLMVNTYLVTDEKTNKGFIVDPGGYDTNMTKKIRDGKIDLEYIILTHGHSDHIGGVAEYQKEFPDVKVVASKYETEMLGDPDINQSKMWTGVAVAVQADITVDEGDTLDVGGIRLRFTMTPGHTKGGMCIITDGVVFSGDTLFCASVGRTDFAGGSFDDLAKSVREKLFVLPDETKVLPGHMGPTTIGFEKEHNPFV